MTASAVSANNVAIRFDNKVLREYVRGNKFKRYMDMDGQNIIHVKKGLKKVRISLIAKLASASGVQGSQTLAGQETPLNNYSKELTPIHYRNGVLIDNEENEKSEFELFEEARPALMNWSRELQRDQIIEALNAIDNGTTYANYGTATGAAMDTWLTNNSDRVLYGAVGSNQSAGNHTTSLGNIDTTADKLTPEMVSLAKRMAKNASPLISPVKTADDEDWFVFFTDSYGMRDLRANSTMTQANREAQQRGEKNPLFTGGDLIWDGVIIREIEDIGRFIDGVNGTGTDGLWGGAAAGDSLKTSGNGTSRVGVGFLCGLQAIGYGWGKNPTFKRRKEDDYEFKNGVGIELKHDIDKMMFNNKQHGIVTVFYSAAVD